MFKKINREEKLVESKNLKDDYNTKLLVLRPTGMDSLPAKTQAEKVHGDSMLGAVRPALLVARLFGVLPVPGIDREGNIREFTWFSFRSIYALVIFLSVFLEAVLSVARLRFIGVSFTGAVNAVFFSYTCAAIYIFLRLATSWKNISKCWDYVELTVMGSYGWPSKLGRRTLCMTVFILLLALVEFVLSMVSHLSETLFCTENRGVYHVLKKLFLVKFPMAFYVTTYSLWKGLILFFLQIVATFTWNLVDVIIVLMSMAISARFKQLNDLISSTRGKERPTEFWRRTRETYFTLSELTRETNRRLGTLILLSFAGNLYFLCLQLMRSVSKGSTSVYHNAYFIISVILLLVRTSLVGLIAAEIHQESKRPEEILYSVPAGNYNVEVQRFLGQVSTDHIAMTGRNFFAVTRSLLLTIAGTIVTYEIILVQFPDKSDPNAEAALVGTNSSYLFCKH